MAAVVLKAFPNYREIDVLGTRCMRVEEKTNFPLIL